MTMTLNSSDNAAQRVSEETSPSYSSAQNAALLGMRLVVAAIFLYAGIAKIPFWSAPPEGMSVLMHNVLRFLVIVEPLGAVAVLFGFLTRWAAAGLAVIMVGAIVYVRFNMSTGIFTSPQGTGLDYNFLILAGSLVLAAFGAGAWSVDAVRKGDRQT